MMPPFFAHLISIYALIVLQEQLRSLKHFDEDGNFIETVEPEIEEKQLNISYTYKKNPEKD